MNQIAIELNSFHYYRIDIEGEADRVWSAWCYSEGVCRLSITDVRDQLDVATTIDEVADILSASFRGIFLKRPNGERDLRRFARKVRDAEDIAELVYLRVYTRYTVADEVKTGIAYQMFYDFPSRTGTFSEARLVGDEVTLIGDPFVDEKGEEFNPFKVYGGQITKRLERSH